MTYRDMIITYMCDAFEVAQPESKDQLFQVIQDVPEVLNRNEGECGFSSYLDALFLAEINRKGQEHED